ncbi:4a-hydroxytetrahydrobiopterin dehydratase [Pseudofulvimonas gallinarii]|jgi:4a-hydroxytetrahydrobiopterin dehydratase|uniref:Putative pterin-4-alpha-carbinolamine dehydratase n=1 Tax=Pseudofulvimonas gallinarii TaxID=634155 RepID=A0A4S3KZW0_9GAMM|nr:4a-hydroxytetrahydrobiopterin dehydratase [Pseudofulvimonas gallinarii]TCT01193.1 4a-hydroxytetrahydrobiopterin dehydratase [Pseudofulvimonas gallinarii]THD14959.1 4a-hydroxytetrahydrobiopterin dehydratase [Pseudofulvimonas gallinarii]
MSTEELRKASCQPLKGAEHRLPADQVNALLVKLPGWTLLDDGRMIGRDYRFDGFLGALSFANALGWIAEQENHHPDLELGWGYCRVRFSTHDVGGLSRNDFICAAKADALLAS